VITAVLVFATAALVTRTAREGGPH
jgi:hypothetical protein